MLILQRAFTRKCLLVHPVRRPLRPPELEHQLAEEAVGLARSVGWDIVLGPFQSRNGKAAPKPRFDELRDGDYVRIPELDVKGIIQVSPSPEARHHPRLGNQLGLAGPLAQPSHERFSS
jgi:hypothetical protein